MYRKLNLNLLLCVLIADLLALVGCASLSGKMENNLYVAPNKSFSCPVPDFGRNWGDKVHISDSVDRKKGAVQAGTVHFSSWYGTDRIDYMAARSAPSQEELALDWMLNVEVDLFRKIPAPQTYVLYHEFNKDHLFAIVIAPGGDLRTVNGYGKHIDLSRAMLIFKNGDYIYAVSTDDADSFAKSDDKSPERINRLHNQIDEFARTIKFSNTVITNL